MKYVNVKMRIEHRRLLLDRVITVLNKNDKSKDELIGSLKDDYIVRAEGGVLYY